MTRTTWNKRLGSALIPGAVLAMLTVMLTALLVGISVWSTTTAEEAGETDEQAVPVGNLVGNLGVGLSGSGGIQRTLHADRSGFAQAFTTGAQSGGYALSSVGIHVSQFFDDSNVADHLQVTIHAVATGGGPGQALCTLSNPSSFPAPGVIAFAAPSGEGACPPLAAGTSYFIVIEWLNPAATGRFAWIPQTYPTEESAATDEDPGGAAGWSIADRSWYLGVSSGERTWTAFIDESSFKIQVKGTALASVEEADENSPATGRPAITGTAQVGEMLTADTSGITDEDGLDDVTFSYQWLADITKIEGATGSSYTPVAGDAGKTLTVRVAFTDDAGNGETLTSEPTASVALPALTVTPHDVPTAHDGETAFSFEIRFSEEPHAEFSYETLKLHAFSVTGGAVQRAQRLQKDPVSNIPWRIIVKPNSNADVTVVLPATANCNDAGAICTEDGRKLSHPLTLTIPGGGGVIR